MKGTPVAQVVALPWMRREDYAALRALFEDGHKFESRWEDWHERAKKIESDCFAKGFIVERVYLDPNSFVEWCRQNGAGADDHGRMKFAAAAVAPKYRKH